MWLQTYSRFNLIIITHQKIINDITDVVPLCYSQKNYINEWINIQVMKIKQMIEVREQQSEARTNLYTYVYLCDSSSLWKFSSTFSTVHTIPATSSFTGDEIISSNFKQLYVFSPKDDPFRLLSIIWQDAFLRFSH